MNVPFLDLSRQTASLRPDLERALARVLDGGRFILGPVVEEFEEAFASYCGASHAVGVASGTDAIAIALRAVGVEPGDEVITAANTCVPTIAGIEAAGAVPVLADVDAHSLTLAPASIEAAITSRTRAVVPVHLYGQCADMEPIVGVARRNGLRVVEDAAQAHGAAYDSRRAGTLGDAAAFSFYPTKNLGALGDAGAVVTDSSEVADRAHQLRAYGEDGRYRSIRRGWNSRLDPLQASVLLLKLSRLDAWNERRRELAGRYFAELADTAVGLPAVSERSLPVYHLFVVRSRDREGFRARLAAAGVETLVHYPVPVHEQPAYSALARDGALTESERAAAEVVSLPLYPELTDDEAVAVVEAVKTAAREAR